MSIIVFKSPSELAEATAEMVSGLLDAAAYKRGVAHLVLSGGGTPRPVYEQWANPPFTDDLPWEALHVWWADERCVPADDPESNYRLAAEAFLKRVDIPPGHIHRMAGELGPEEGALAYGAVLQRYARPGGLWPRFDVCILGIGRDGHTASLFPGEPADDELVRPAIGVTADYDGRPARRISLTPPVINASRTVIVLATGEDKAEILGEVFSEKSDPDLRPVERIRPLDGDLIWMLDEAAAGQIDVG